MSHSYAAIGKKGIKYKKEVDKLSVDNMAILIQPQELTKFVFSRKKKNKAAAIVA